MTYQHTLRFPAAALLLTLAPALPSSGAILVGWETWTSGSESASQTSGDASGLATENAGDWRETNRASSNDGTFGTAAGASTATGSSNTGTHIGQNNTAGSYNFTITAGANQLVLDTFHFDARRKRSGSPEVWNVQIVSGDITNQQIGNGSLGNTLGGIGPSDHDDFDLDLTGLADRTLDPGESATFRISFSGGTQSNTDQRTYLDNVAVSGDAVIPEPTSLALLGLGGLLVARRRRS